MVSSNVPFKMQHVCTCRCYSVVGCGAMKISESARTVSFTSSPLSQSGSSGSVGGGGGGGVVAGVVTTFKEGDVVSLNGATGEVIRGAVKLVLPSTAGGDLATVMKWADEYRTLRVLANADTPDDAATAGYGLSIRTHHILLQ